MSEQPKKQMSDKLKIALISSITAVVVALLTGYFSVMLTIKSQDNELGKATTKITKLNLDIDKMNNPPVGSIIASVLSPEKFAEAVGDPSTFDLLTSKWTLADDKGRVPGTKYAALTNNASIPDLRGVFLRGNAFGRFGIATTVGVYTPDKVGPHTHRVRFSPISIRNRDSEHNPGEGALIPGSSSHLTESNGGTETLPKNVVVNYYIRIN